MKNMMVVGLGSMGKRRIRLTKMLVPDARICGVDSQSARREDAETQFGISTYESIAQAIEKESPEAGFVCTSPLAHHAVIMELLHADLHVFTEINLISDGYDEMLALAKAKERVLFLSSTFLYRKDIRYMINRVKNEKVDYMIHIGQYLPDWHPWESYKSFFVGDKRTNGCREIMAIDFPWVLSAFGKVTDMHVRSSKNSDLELDYDDNYILSFAHENGSKGVVVVDLLSRKATRNALIFSDKLQLSWNGVPDSLMEYSIAEKCDQPVQTYHEALDHQSAYASNIIENAYMDEIRSFLGLIEGTATAAYTFEDDLYTLSLIDRIEGKR
ncbi:MAG: Gfo/Idh/MocA family oxidoreductase [Clostridia bacterium]